jgi:CRISPR-associated protein Cst1
MMHDRRPLLHYTGHPFLDVGVATITAFVQKADPGEVTEADLEQVIAYIEQNYVRPPLRGHLTMAFTSNAWFIQDAFNPDRPGLSAEDRMARQKTRDDWAARHLRQWQMSAAISEAERCVFTGQPAIATTLSKTLPRSRAARNQVPLLQGDDAINFFTYGDSGLPISGTALAALQFFPMGCAKCGVGLLAVHADDDRLTYEMARHFLNKNMRDVLQAQSAGDDKLPGAVRSPRTLLIETLLEVEGRRQRVEQDDHSSSLTAYNFNNGKTPSLVLYHLPLEIINFLRVANSETYRDTWAQLVRRAWEKVEPKQGRRKKEAGPPPEPRRNYLYEDLFTLFEPPQNLGRFIRSYFLRIPRRTVVEADPRRDYAPRREAQLVSWALVELFLGKVVHMDTDRIKLISDLGDGLAEYVRAQGGRRFFRQFFTEQRANEFRALLIKANLAHIRAGREPLFDLHGYIAVFEEGQEVMRPDWRLARDLVLIRMIDRLRDWLSQNPDAVPETEELSTGSDAEALTAR